MSKTLTISIGVLIVIGLVVLIIFKLFTGSNSQVPTTNTLYTGGLNTEPSPTVSPSLSGSGTQASSGNTISIAATNGGTIQANNFKNDPATTQDPINTGYYYLGYHVYGGVPDSTSTNTLPYVIEYIDTTQYFNIELLQEPIGVTRQQAEQYLMAHLGISQSQMCELNYMVSVPYSVNQFYSSRSLGFSFCPGATALQ